MPLNPPTDVSGVHASAGEKHARDGEPSSPNAAIVEIIHGITQLAAAAHAADRSASAACVYSADGLAALLPAPSLRPRARLLISTRGTGPADAGVVQLVARDATLLVFADAACAPLCVAPETGRRVCAGDALLFRRPAAGGGDAAAADDCVVLAGLAPAALADAGDWALAAGANAMACAALVRRLLACPPGIAQLTCIAQIMQSPAGLWTRVLQLPLLLQHGPSTEEQSRLGHVTEMREIQWIRRIIHSLLRIVVIVLSSAEAIVPMPRIAREATHAFLASPLFVDGITVVLPRLAGVVTESTWTAVQQTMHDAVQLALRTVCRDDLDTSISPHGAAEAERHSEHGCFTVLHRLTDPNAGCETSRFPVDMGLRGAVPAAGQRAMRQLVAELARSGALRRVAHWLRSHENAAIASDLVDTANCPPSTQDIRELNGLHTGTVAEMLGAMKQTYSPYLRQEPGRFAEGAMLAAYAELYGPAARAASRFMELASSPSLPGVANGKTCIATAAAEMRGLRVVDLVQPALRSSLDAYTAREVEMHALFGMPVKISFGMTEVSAYKETFDAQLQELIASTRDSSMFAIVVVVLIEKTFTFPAILCDVTLTADHTATAAAGTAYILRDRDMLPSLLAASAAGERLPKVWLMHTDTGFFSHANGLSDPPPRLLPRGTPAVSYILYIRHVYALLARLRRDEQQSAPRPAKARDEPQSAGGPLWWRPPGAGTAAADHFAPDPPVPGEADATLRSVTALTSAAVLSAAQAESLHTLSVAGPGVRALVGAVGSGKTTIACAAGLTRGRALAALRAQQQPQWIAALRRSAQALTARLGELAAAEDVAELFGAAGAGAAARETLEDAAGAAAVHAREHTLLSERLQHCHAPFLLRPRAQRATPPPAQALRVLCAPPSPAGGLAAAEEEQGGEETEREEEKGESAQDKARALAAEFQGVDELLANGHRRALHAPLVAVLRERMAALRRIGDHCDAILRAAEKAATGGSAQEGAEADETNEESGQLCEELLPWLMARRERCESIAEAARRTKPWAAYIAEDLWDAHSFTASHTGNHNKNKSKDTKKEESNPTHNIHNKNKDDDDDDDDQDDAGDHTWMCLKPIEGEFRAVELPSATRGLCVYGRAEALAWRTVFIARQRDFAVHLQHTVFYEAQQVFLLLHEVLCAVAAAPPTARGSSTNNINTPTVISATGLSLLHALPLLHAYRPRVLIIDDYDQLTDALFLALSPAAAVVLTQQAEAPLPHERHAAGAILTALRRTIGTSPLASSASLAESQRFTGVSLHTAVQLCRNAHIDTRRAAIRAAAAALGTDSSPSTGSGSGQTTTSRPMGRHARNQAKILQKNYKESEVAVKSSAGEKTDNKLPGLSSPSSVELWTHAVPLHAAIAADACAAAFIRRRALAIDDKIAVSVFTPFPADADAVAADASFSLFTSDYIESDSECDIAVLCMSGIASRIATLTGNSREAQWAHAAESPIVESLEWWLWRAIGRARKGAVLVGSYESFDALEPLRRVARFVAHDREAKGYWLPPEAQAAVLAICCPDHERAREIAVVSVRGESCGESRPFIQLSGARECRSLCLKPYDNCGNPSHACLRPCHAMQNSHNHRECQKGEEDLDSAPRDTETQPLQNEKESENNASAHAHCPFPCGRAQPCGHVCVRRCGDVCEPCEFVGLYELPCGQQVVCGTADAGGPAFALVRHFQRVRCGEPPQPCDARVTLRCVRCGTRTALRCSDAAAQGGMEAATLSEKECTGCVALFNRVAAEFGAKAFHPDAEAGAGELPLATLSEEALEKLQRLRGFAARKAQLMLQTEALEVMQGRADAECNQLRRAHAEQRERQAEELQQHKQRVQAAMQEWSKTLREKYEQQMGFNEEMDTEVPLMTSQAIAEAERQEGFHFA